MAAPEKIDIVVLWVDGSDPAHFEKRQRFVPKTEASHREAVLNTRFADCGEVYYCIASILRYASFVNKVWIITDNQRPKFLDTFHQAGLCKKDFIEVIDHKTVFRGYESALPVFNSISIEAVIWRIPGLAEHFVYLNDDFFFNRDISTDFLFENGVPVLRGWMARPAHMRMKVRVRRRLRKLTFRPPNNRPSFRISQELGSALAGNDGRFLHIGHHPHPMRKSVIEGFFETADPSILADQVSHRFRSVEQYNMATLANHLEIANSNPKILPPVEVAYFKPTGKSSIAFNFDRFMKDMEPYGCIQSLDEADDQYRQDIRAKMARKFGKYLPEPAALLG